MFRILHVGLGPLGQKIVADLHQRKLGEVVAAVDVSSDLVGRKLSDIVPAIKSKVVVQKSIEDVKSLDSIHCAIVTTSSELEKCTPTFRDLLGRGMSIVSTCEELCYPYLRHKKLAAELDGLARDGRGRLLGTGVNPGFLMDAFPVTATAISKSVKSVEVHRYQDATIRRLPFQKKIGVGLSAGEFDEQVDAGTLRHVGLGESIHFIASYLGFDVDRWNEDIHPVVAERDMESGLGLVKKGSICGVRQEARGFQGKDCVVHLKFQAAIGLADPHDRVIIDGEPPIDITWKAGVPGDVATSAIVLNSIAPLLLTAPGLHTMATIPMVGCAPPRAPVDRARAKSAAR
jgi:4-hydroxy-tetrahydrodipicolinate reductase